jgi:hypothetical protein
MAIIKATRNNASSRRASVRLEMYLVSGKTSDKDLEFYLELGHEAEESRVIAYAHSDHVASEDPSEWSKSFEAVRQMWGKADGRQYYHYVFSPDPEDKLSPEECRDMASEWIEKSIPGSQWIVVVHNDNNRAIVHAHVVVNAVHPETGDKLQISAKDWNRMSELKNEICHAHGLGTTETVFEHLRNNRWESQSKAREAAIAQMKKRGARSWVEDIRNQIDLAANESHSWSDFMDRLNRNGVRVTREKKSRGEGLVFWHPQSNGTKYKIRGKRLGGNYTEAALCRRMSFDFRELKPGRQVLGEIDQELYFDIKSRELDFNLNRPEKFGDRMISLSYKKNATQKTLELLSVLKSFGITNRADLKSRLLEVDKISSATKAQVDNLRAGLSQAEQLFSEAQLEILLKNRLSSLQEQADSKPFLNPKARFEIKDIQENLNAVSEKLDNSFAKSGLSVPNPENVSSRKDLLDHLIKDLRTDLKSVEADHSKVVSVSKTLKSADKFFDYLSYGLPQNRTTIGKETPQIMSGHRGKDKTRSKQEWFAYYATNRVQKAAEEAARARELSRRIKETKSKYMSGRTSNTELASLESERQEMLRDINNKQRRRH